MNKTKTYILFTMIMAVTILGASLTGYAATTNGGGSSASIIYIVDGDQESLLVGCEPVFEEDGTILIPLRSLSVGIDYKTSATDNELELFNGNRTISVQSGSNIAAVDGQTVTLTTPISYDDNEFYADLNDIETLFSYETNYDEDRHIIIFTVTDETPQAIIEPEIPEETGSAATAEPVNTPEPTAAEEPEEDNTKVLSKSINVVSYGDDLRIYVSDVQVDFKDAKPFVDEEDRTQIPVRALAEVLDCDVAWNDAEQLVTITLTDGTIVQMTIGDRFLKVGDKIVEMDTEALIIEDRTYIPIRFLAEALGLNVFWDWDV